MALAQDQSTCDLRHFSAQDPVSKPEFLRSRTRDTRDPTRSRSVRESHFPLRAATIPRAGRLVCTDLADHLACWTPGGGADLHVIPSTYDAAERVFRRLAGGEHAEGRGVRAVNLHLHLDTDAPGSPLAEIDRLATPCQGFLLAPDGDMIVINTERIDSTIYYFNVLITCARQFLADVDRITVPVSPGSSSI